MSENIIHEITILPGRNRNGEPEGFDEIRIKPGDTISIVGPTGSGKSALINDIEIFASRDTITKRQILVNGTTPPDHFIRDPARKPVAMITQNTRCLCDLSVEDFLCMHTRSRGYRDQDLVEETVSLANQFTGEAIRRTVRMTQLSGGQTRSLMVADAILISNTPIILLDEVENAGIFKNRVIEALRRYHKALLFVTHDPLVSLLSDRRIVMHDGAVAKVLTPNGSEQSALKQMLAYDAAIAKVREQIRAGELITNAIPA
ncbi:MAG: ATP-binding cassette domain-containing protein [Methanospirillum sp.]|uniref:ATP-binding cassette domain-containing protein n=1 Tax=Methanospirillum sp. TaxID=45200 RepID=UPI00237527C6|nr:ATP-binding cassette domain-containing protein [Methanospirillum sp.]MDD1730140.1 ATP-binding cassette domain-containing protein [Methanospirillum sp.]